MRIERIEIKNSAHRETRAHDSDGRMRIRDHGGSATCGVATVQSTCRLRIVPRWAQRYSGLCLAAQAFALELSGCGLGPTKVGPKPPQAAAQSPQQVTAPVAVTKPAADAATQTPEAPANAVTSDAALAATAMACPTAANKYTTHLSWNALTGVQAYVVRRHGDKEEPKQLDILTPETTSYDDSSVAPGKTYTYELLGLSEGTLSTRSSIELTVPKDFEVTGTATIDKIGSEFNRLFLSEGAHLYAKDGRLEIDVNEIVAFGGTVESMPAGATAPTNQPGRDGGRITIKANSGRGVLTVIARGENGGDGSQGSPGATGGPGSKGADAKDFPGFFTGGSLIPSSCKRQPNNGGPGESGGQGGRGNAGQAGGASAEVLIEIKDPTSFAISPIVATGFGGKGGPGGVGGPGGPGGTPGFRGKLKACSEASSGPSGTPGAAGPQGFDGANGREMPFCLRLGTSETGNCQ